MRFGIIGAMASEIEILKDKANCTASSYKNLTFFEGKLGPHEVVIVKSGIGKVCAAVSATLLIERFNCDAVINSGVAGGLYEDCVVGDEVIATKLAYHDVDVTVFDYKKGQLPDHPLYFECDKTLITKASQYVQGRVITGTIISGDQFICADEKVKELRALFDEVKAAEMEGAAVAQVCHDFNTPFLVIRAISDGANDGAALSFEEFELLAAKKSSELLIKLIENYA